MKMGNSRKNRLELDFKNYSIFTEVQCSALEIILKCDMISRVAARLC